MKRLLLLALLSGCSGERLSEKTPTSTFRCVPVGWSFVSVQDGSVTLRQGTPTTPNVFWVVTNFKSTESLYIEAGADPRCPAPQAKPEPQMHCPTGGQRWR